MTRIPKLVLVITALIFLSFATPAVNAVTTVVGASNDLTRYPFGKDPGAASSAFPDFATGGTYQQVYAGSAFSGPVTITQLAFASKGQLTSGPGVATYNFNLALSTTAVAPGALSTNLAANRGADFVQVFSGQLTATITANNQFDLVIDITPFTYNPANGNLLLEINFNSPTQFTGGAVLYYNAGFDSRTSRAANPSGSAGGAFTDGFAIETRFTIRGAAQVALGNLEQTFDGSPKSVVVNTDPPGLEVAVTYDGSATPPTNAGSYAVNAMVSDPGFVGQASGNLIIHKADQQIAFDPLPNKTFTDPDFSINATASSNLAVSFAANGNCTVTGTQVHLNSAGSCTITATQDGDANINPAPAVSRTFSITRAAQQVTFEALANKTFGDADFNVSATASSNLAVSLTASGQCAVTGSTVHITGAGSCQITASQTGDSNFNAATAVQRSFQIGKAATQTSVISSMNPSTTGQSVTFTASVTSAVGGLTGTVTFKDGGNVIATCSDVALSSGQATCGTSALAAGSHAITADYSGDTNFDAFPSNTLTQQVNVSCTNTSTVINNHDSGEGSLRDAIAGTCSGGAVKFDFPGTEPLNIVLTNGEIIIDSGLTITGPIDRSVTINGNNSGRVFDVRVDNSSVTISNLTITNGNAGANVGGAILNSGATTLNLFNSTLSDNHARQGGAICNLGGTVNVANSTLSGNTASSQGGGIYQATGTIKVLNSTVTGNTATDEGGGIYNNGAGPINITNSIVALNNAPTGTDLRNIISSQGHNIVGSLDGATITAASGDQFGVTAAQLKLGALADHGGTTRTHALLSGSPAIDAGDTTAAVNFDLATDQRGHARYIGSAIDIGAYEAGGVTGDFDRDLLSNFAVWRPSTGTWFTSTDAAINYGAFVWGQSGDVPVPGDFDGDGKTDEAIFRPSEGIWYIHRSLDGQTFAPHWGLSTDLLAPADYDGDGKTDVAVFRDGQWFIRRSSDGQTFAPAWGFSTDKPVPADYDGDGKADVAVFRPSDGTWYVLRSSNGQLLAVQWGLSTDQPVPADYDGDGKVDFAVFRDGVWYILNSSNGEVQGLQWGLGSDILVPADYDGDGKTDVAVFRRSDNTFYVLKSTGGALIQSFGTNGDIPILSVNLPAIL